MLQKEGHDQSDRRIT